MKRRLAGALLAAWWAASPMPSSAQAPPTTTAGQPAVTAAESVPARPPRYELALGPAWLGGYDLGARSAQLTGNLGQPGLVLFETDTEMAGGFGLDAKLGYRLTPTLRLEAGLAYSRPELRTSVSDDAEGADALVAVDPVSQYVVEGALLAYVPRWQVGNGVPYALAGAGYLRQVASEGAAVDSGGVYHAGGGMAWERAGAASWLDAWGLRADVRVNLRTGGIDIEDATRVWPSLSARFYVAF
jgi:opacity protein-like surface antigen